LAATTCSASWRPVARREKALRRGSIPTITGSADPSGSPPGVSRTARSPTTTALPRALRSPISFPRARARTMVPSVHFTRHPPKSTRTTSAVTVRTEVATPS
jgi:hypothetical protein